MSFAGATIVVGQTVAAMTDLPVVICGAGVIGVSIAYQLGLRGVRSTLVDKVGLCPAASGKAGGFLALDWNDGVRTRSFLLRCNIVRHAGVTEWLQS
eukprot:6211269-Pleurochrysis_carterae.AAC.2